MDTRFNFRDNFVNLDALTISRRRVYCFIRSQFVKDVHPWNNAAAANIRAVQARYNLPGRESYEPIKRMLRNVVNNENDFNACDFLADETDAEEQDQERMDTHDDSDVDVDVVVRPVSESSDDHTSSGSDVTMDSVPEVDVPAIVLDLQHNNRQDEVLRLYRGTFGVNVAVVENLLQTIVDVSANDTLTVARGTFINPAAWRILRPTMDDESMAIRVRPDADNQNRSRFSTHPYGYQMVNYIQHVTDPNLANCDYVIQEADVALDNTIHGMQGDEAYFMLVYATISCWCMTIQFRCRG